jgi:hypothetical protein
MSGKNLCFTLLFVASAAGCAGAEKGHVDPRVAAQVMVSRLDPPRECSYVSTIEGSTNLGELSDAHGDLIRQAVLGGGNFVAVDMLERRAIGPIGGYTIHARLYACAGGPAPIQAAAPPPSESRVASDTAGATVNLPRTACEPECAAGFTCVKAVCEKAP